MVTPRTPQARWTRPETIAALSLYCQIPFGSMHSKNPRVKSLASTLGRSASSIALKLGNLASLDPVHQRRGIRGMSNASQLDREIWEEFYGHWDILADTVASDNPDSQRVASSAPRSPRQRENRATESIEERIGRRGQQFFRSSIISAYEQRCCITEISTPELLRASHIVPWSVSVDDRLDPCNGLCLNSLHDAAFDRGLIAIATDMRLLVSPRLRETIPEPLYATMFERYEGRPVRLPSRFAPRIDFLTRHRESIYRS